MVLNSSNKSIVIVLACFFFIQFGFGQELIEKQFDADFTLTLTDVEELNDGFLIAGWGSSSLNDSSMAIVIRTDEQLNISWSKRYKALLKDDFTQILSLSDGNFLVSGASKQGLTIGCGSQVYKIDSSGNVIWSKTFTGSCTYRMLAMYEEDDGSLTLFIRHGVTNEGTKILRVSAEGTLISQRIYEIDGNGVFADIVTKGENGIYYLSGDYYNGPDEVHSLFIWAINGVESLWYKRYQLDRAVGVRGLIYRDGGGITVSGGITHPTAFNFRNNYALSTDVNGVVTSIMEYEKADENSWLNSTVGHSDDGFIQLGSSTSLNDTTAIFYNVSNDLSVSNLTGYTAFGYQALSRGKQLEDGRILLIGLNSEGNYLLLVSSEGQSACSSIPISLITTELTAVTSVHNPVQEPPIVEGIDVIVEVSDLEIVSSEICNSSVSVDEKLADKFFEVYPNPFSNKINVHPGNAFAESHSVSVELKDLLGNVILSQDYNHSKKIRVDVPSYVSQGVYVLTLKSESISQSVRLVRN